MKIILLACTGLIFILTVINKIRSRFRPNTVPDNRWIVIGLVFSILALIAIYLHYHYTKDAKELSKLLVPVVALIILSDQYRRNKKLHHLKSKG
jgi:glucan phosphoethanolaminetransferase (alkaline phosphatase superfamily)